jgi:hypothetical protein
VRSGTKGYSHAMDNNNVKAYFDYLKSSEIVEM